MEFTTYLRFLGPAVTQIMKLATPSPLTQEFFEHGLVVGVEVVHNSSPVGEGVWSHPEGVGVQDEVQHIPSPGLQRILVA